jgi:diguanylate cyclase (GGDEF)-like protein
MAYTNSGSSNKKIMIIDDNILTLNQVRDYFYDHGFMVIPCKSSEEAGILLVEAVPDLIILDIIMPDLDGYEFCKWIRDNKRLKHVPIVFLTARDTIDDKIAGLRIGGDDYVTKPFSMEELYIRVGNILRRMDNYHHLAMHDELTNAYNRRCLNERMEEEIYRVRRTGRPFSVVVIDVDNFKNINDGFGHPAGDFVLIEIVRFLQHHSRKTDLVARLGGEEFVLLLTDTTSGRAYLLMERLRKLLGKEVFQYNEQGTKASIRITVSSGIACCPEHNDNTEGLLALADKAMYAAKAVGRNTTKIAITG